MIGSRDTPRILDRLTLVGALVLHLLGAALSPWAHARSAADHEVTDARTHAVELHLEASDPGHETCALCHAAAQPTLAGVSPSTPPPLAPGLAPTRHHLRLPLSRPGLSVRARAPPRAPLGSPARA